MKKRFLSIVLILSIILSFNTIISFAGTLEEDDVINENNIELYLRGDDTGEKVSRLIVRVKNKTGKEIIVGNMVCENHSWYASDGSKQYTVAANEEKNLVFYSSDEGFLSTRKYSVLNGATAGINIQYVEPVEGHPVTLIHRCLFDYHGIKSFYDSNNNVKEKDIKVKLDGNILSFDVPPQIINDRTMVPLRAIFEALGASVEWNQETKTVTSTKGDTTIKLTIDSNTMYVNDNAVTLDSPACVVNDRTLVPVRAISEAYKTKVDWNGDTRTVTISSDNIVSTPVSDIVTSENAFNKVKNYILTNGTQNVKTEDEEYYVFIDNGDLLLKQNLIIKLSYNVDTNTINMYLGQSSNDTYDEGIATINIDIKENTEPTLKFYAGEMVKNSLSEFEIYGYFDKNTNKFVETETKNLGKTAKLGNTEHNLFNSYLKLFGMGYLLSNTGATLNDLGIYIDLSDTNVNTNTNTTSQSTSTSNKTWNGIKGYEYLKNKIIANGTYIAERDTYAVLEQISNNSDMFIAYMPTQSNKISMMYTVDFGTYTTHASLMLDEDGQPTGIITLSTKTGEQSLIGKFSNTDHKFYKTGGNVPSNSEQNAISLLNSGLSYIDEYLKINNFDVKLSDFGVAY